jgi:DNA (cytosine-5)-methyltransferase 1
MHPLVIDNFAGGGGASTGIERAIGRPIDVAINHDPEAIAMHLANHPATKHYCQSIMSIDPLDATGGMPVDLAWFSPDCKHHSKAKGGKPRDKNIRDLAWVVVHWAERLRKATPNGSGAPRVIMLENVEEFRQWGPLDADGLPIKERRGEEFELWKRRLRAQGYRVEHRELRACDYGAPTSRKRLYLIARRDGQRIVWPEPTHRPRDERTFKTWRAKLRKEGFRVPHPEQLLPWRTAAECIDWSIPCPSIFDRKRPLKDATHRRIAHGVMRYVVNAAEPFIVRTAHGEVDRHGKRRGKGDHDLSEPLPTVTASRDMACVDAAIIPITHASDGPGRTHDPAEPLRTITTANGGELARVTVTVAPHVTKFRTGSVGSPADDPMPTVTANGDSARPAGATPLGVVAATMVQAGYGERDGQEPRSLDVKAPLGTVVAGGGKHAAVTAFLSHFYTSNTNGGRGDPDQPAKAITAEGQRHAVVCAHMEQANTGVIGHDMREAVSTIVGKGCTQRLVETTILEEGALPPEMMDRAVRVAAFLIKYYGNEEGGHGLDAPIGTVTTLDRFAVVTVTIDTVTYVIVDIGMRMLTRRELANAQGFPRGYILDPIGPNGKPLSISSSIRMIGNSVCPDVPDALVHANLPEVCISAEPEEMVA